MEYRELFYEISDSFCLYVAEQCNYQDKCPIVSETFVKVPGGIRHAVRRHQDFIAANKLQLVEKCLADGHFSRRPYRAGQPCDGSIDACVLALLDSFLTSIGRHSGGYHSNDINLTELYHAAYPGEQPITQEQITEIRAFAQWQGVVIPSQWRSIEPLLELLHAVNLHELALELEARVTPNNFNRAVIRSLP